MLILNLRSNELAFRLVTVVDLETLRTIFVFLIIEVENTLFDARVIEGITLTSRCMAFKTFN